MSHRPASTLRGWSLALGLVLAAELASAQTGHPFLITLTGSSAAPGPGDPDGSGRAELTLNPARGEICYTLTVAGIAPATAAHIHRAVAGQTGPAVVPLGPPANGTSRDCVTVDPQLVRNILEHPANYYVDVHNSEYPGGALRGQLSR